MREKYTATRIIATGALGCAVLTGCGAEQEPGVKPESSSPAASYPAGELTPPTNTPRIETPAPKASPSELPYDIISGKGSALVCRGLVVLQVPGGFRTVANPIVEATTKQPLFIENASSAGITVDKEPGSDGAAAWYNLKGQAQSPADIACKQQVIYTHEVSPPSGADITVATTSAQEFSGTTRLDLDAIQGPDGLVSHDFGVEGQVAMQQRLEQLQ